MTKRKKSESEPNERLWNLYRPIPCEGNRINATFGGRAAIENPPVFVDFLLFWTTPVSLKWIYIYICSDIRAVIFSDDKNSL